MREFLRRHGSLLLRGSILAAVVLLLCSSRGRWTPVGDTDGRIRYYQPRIGGPASYPAYARLGGAYLQKGRETGRAEYYDEAEGYLEQSIRSQRNFEAARWLAAAYSARHKFRQALPYAREAVSAVPSDLEAQGTLFDAYLGVGDRQAAAEVLTAMRRRGPTFFSDTRLAAMRKTEGRLEQAIQAMERACATAEADEMPTETRAWCQVEAGFLYFQNGDRKHAQADYENALRIFPGYHHALKHMADLASAGGQLAKTAAP